MLLMHRRMAAIEADLGDDIEADPVRDGRTRGMGLAALAVGLVRSEAKYETEGPTSRGGVRRGESGRSLERRRG